MKIAGVVCSLVVLCLYFFWSNQRVDWWIGASQHAQELYTQIEAAAKKESRPIAIINMPDRYGPEGMIWLPYLWRCGQEHFSFSFPLAYTVDCIHPPPGAHMIPRAELAEYYPNYALYSVDKFTLVPMPLETPLNHRDH